MGSEESGRRKTRVKRKRRRLKKSVRRFLFAIFMIVLCLFFYNNNKNGKTVTNGVGTRQTELEGKKEIKTEEASITISAAGDFTLGTDENFAYTDSFPDEASTNGLPYFVKELGDIFKEDDLSTVNLETTLTNATQRTEKRFSFKGDPSYAEILEIAGIESVNLANNHTFDYLQKGYDDTLAALQNHKIGFFGYETQYVTTIKGVKLGALGYQGWEDTPELRSIIEEDIEELREQDVSIILVHFHWGTEKSYMPNDTQQSLARFAIDSGADLILGHHPHVVQGIEEYNDKFIVYSLGNFMFGGHSNPSDKDTFVFQQTFQLKNGELSNRKELKIVPFSISSVTSRNNYQPKRLHGFEAERVKKKIIDLSNQINGSDWVEYEASQ
ncbi:CapA family protein [Bacillus sp. CECT 9360]|uniref:CapA family protein n=1 Tax=Bacillus sp. CECT 9360 TaxID=2845821 RepID=UPI001E4AEABE|nr:CapA family protein [Bacillus sp. CECT 9360]